MNKLPTEQTRCRDIDISPCLFFIYFLQPLLIFIGIRVTRPSRKDISSMLSTSTRKESKLTAMTKNLKPSCITTGPFHILN